MIVTVTLNPALDRIIRVNSLKSGQLHRCIDTSIRAGGKGINVARVIKDLGEEVIALSLLGVHTGAWIKEIMTEEKIPVDITEINAATRENIKIIETENRKETEINSTTSISAEEYGEFKEMLVAKLPETELLILAGSVPHGLPDNIYSQLLLLAADYNVRTILDTSGILLEEALNGSQLPFLIKPNLQEIRSLMNNNIKDIEDIFKAADQLQERGLINLVVSLGSGGALFVNNGNKILVQPPEINVKETTVGAGDTLVGGLAVGIVNGCSFEEIAKYSTAAATSFVSNGDIKEDYIIQMKDRLKIRTY
ncbi:MAG: 1-phosphofructokinase family hexose kinase [Halanaerobiales bacterium]